MKVEYQPTLRQNQEREDLNREDGKRKKKGTFEGGGGVFQT